MSYHCEGSAEAISSTDRNRREIMKYRPVISLIYEGVLPFHREPPQIYCHSGGIINEARFAKADEAVFLCGVCVVDIKMVTNQTDQLNTSFSVVL